MTLLLISWACSFICSIFSYLPLRWSSRYITGSRTGKGRRIVYIFRHYSVFILCLYSVPNEIEILPAGRTVRRYNHSLLAVYGNYPLYKIRARDLILSFHRRTLERKSNVSSHLSVVSTGFFSAHPPWHGVSKLSKGIIILFLEPAANRVFWSSHFVFNPLSPFTRQILT